MTLGTGSSAEAYEYLGNKKWEPGLNTVALHGTSKIFPPMTPGDATWSAIPSGVGLSPDAPVLAFEPGATTTDIEFLVTPEVDGLEYSIINQVIDIWASVSGFTNLGKVDDGATLFPGTALIADTDANHGHVGDLRIAAIPLRGTSLARAYAPCVNGFDTCSDGGSVGGDVFFDIDTEWIDDPDAEIGDSGFDFFTVALHEVGHALGLDHTSVAGAVMRLDYQGARRALTPDDIEGIQALYGPIPEPSTVVLASLAAIGLLGSRRRQSLCS